MAAHKASLTSAKKENAFSPDVWAVFSHDRFVWSAVSFTYFTVLGVEPRASCTLGKLPTTDLCFLSPFRTFCFEVGSSHSTAQASLELTSLPGQSLIRSPPAQPPGSQAYAISPYLAERFPCAVERSVRGCLCSDEGWSWKHMGQKTTECLQVALLGQSCHNWVVMWKQVGSEAGMVFPSASWERAKAFCLGVGTHFVLPWSLLADMSWQFFPKPAFTCPSPARPSRLLLV